MSPASSSIATKIVEFKTTRMDHASKYAPQPVSRIDPSVQPPDERLVTAFGPVRALQYGMLPWRTKGGTTIVLSPEAVLDDVSIQSLEAQFGDIRLAHATRPDIEAAILRIAGPSLARAAETRVPSNQSCRSWSVAGSRRVLGATAASLMGLAILAPAFLLITLIGLATLALVLNTGLKVAAALADMRHRPEITAPEDVPILARRHIISLLVPLFQERAVATHIIRRLDALDYPRDKLDVCLIVEDDDILTQRALQQTALPDWARVIHVPRGSIQTKPRALNYAMTFAKGSIIGIYDAEDTPEPQQLNKVVERFAQRPPDLACLQGVLDFHNPQINWIARCFTLEYAIWFRLVLPGLQRMGLVLPLGGTTLFFRRGALEDVGGWDAHNVTEDADLGIRLARAGYRTEILETVTQEEANVRPWPWVRQRSRWLKGYAMTWAVHMRKPGQLLRDLGPWKFFGVQLLFLGTLSAFLLAPLLWSFWLILLGLPHPLSGTVDPALLRGAGYLYLGSEVLSLGVATWAARRAGRPMLALWAPMMHLYFPMATLAAYKGIAEMISRPFFWDKTEHGLHDLEATPPPLPSRHPIAAE